MSIKTISLPVYCANSKTHTHSNHRHAHTMADTHAHFPSAYHHPPLFGKGGTAIPGKQWQRLFAGNNWSSSSLQPFNNVKWTDGRQNGTVTCRRRMNMYSV